MAMNIKGIRVSISTNALGISSGTGFMIPGEKFENGKAVGINSWMPPQYRAYVKDIYLTLTDDSMSIESPYKNQTVTLKPNCRINIDGVGLSYATCDITIWPEF